MASQDDYQYWISTAPASGETIVAVHLRGSRLVGVSSPLRRDELPSEPTEIETALENYDYQEEAVQAVTANRADWRVYDPLTQTPRGPA